MTSRNSDQNSGRDHDRNDDRNGPYEPEREHEHGYGQVPRHGGWEPVPHGGEYEPDATAFVQLPPDMDLMGAPLAAPGHGYVPPMIVPLTPAAATDPGATGVWRIPTELTGQGAPGAPEGDPAPGAQTVVWPEPAAPTPVPATPTHPAHDPSATAQWNFADEPSLAGTGQWTIPVADGELPEESGEFTTSSLIEQWGSTPPATLPGGAPAPWANQLPEPPAPEAVEEPAAPPASPAPETHAAPPAPEVPDVRDVSDPLGHADTPAPEPHAHPEAAHTPHTPEPPAPTPGAFAPEPPPEVPLIVEPLAEAVPEASAPDAPDAPDVPQAPQPAAEAVPDAVAEPTGTGDVPKAREAREAQEVTEAQGNPEGREAQDSPGTPEAAEPVAGAEPESEPAPALAGAPDLEHPRASYVLRVNGADRPVTEAWVGESLLYVLRERLGLAGAKDGCSQGECGACNVQVDGRLVASCLVPAATTAGSEVRTVEGLATDGEPSDVQRALAESGAVQCGFCIPGMAMTVHDLLEGNHAPTELETRQALCGNLCRCSGYRGVLDAVKDVVAGREAAGAAPADEARIPHQAPPGAGSAKPPHTHDGGMA
ncbi:2Fe-2S iron-sulfur cluster-binding protein [Streptomyces sp. NPDC056670]|uniref:(2Fe-2S)-binding protein n=1 Tax=Streptomyces sp. NPDC056670 TaxID=3345904 RepID=UPI0036B5547B